MKSSKPCLPGGPLCSGFRQGRSKGMASLEMVLVLLPLGLLVFVIVIKVLNQFENAGVWTTRAELKSIEKALRKYSKKNGYLSQNEGLSALMNPPGGQRPYLKKEPKDAWDHAVLYFKPARKSLDPFEVMSKGPDGKYGTPDDVYVKKRKKPR